MNEKYNIHPLTVITPNNTVLLLSLVHKVMNEHDDEMQVMISAVVNENTITITAETTEDALIKLAKTLPKGWHIKSCLSCRHGHFCPIGNLDNELFCMSDFTPKNIQDIQHITENDIERDCRRRNLFHLCENYALQTKDFFTYSDYYSELYE